MYHCLKNVFLSTGEKMPCDNTQFSSYPELKTIIKCLTLIYIYLYHEALGDGSKHEERKNQVILVFLLLDWKYTRLPCVPPTSH